MRPEKVQFDTPEKGQKTGAHLGSMRNLRPSTNGAASSDTPKQKFIDKETGEIVICDHLQDGSLRVESDLVQIRIDRFIIQSAVRQLLPGKRITKCLRLATVKQGSVSVNHAVRTKSAHYGGLQTCGSVWDCSVCAPKISERRRVDEVSPAMDRWEGEGGQCLLLTLTNPHNISDVLDDLLKGQQKAMRSMTSARGYKTLMKSLDSVGTIRAWEVTHGVNGWHPHFHIILFVRTYEPTGFDLEVLEVRFYELWANACRLAKLPIPSLEHGVSLHDGSKAHAYVTKGVWGLDHEITKGHLKKSRGGRSPMDLARSYALDGDKQAGALFVEYSKAYHGKAQLYWSPGLKAYFAIEVKTDELIAAEQDETAILLGRIEYDQWRVVLKFELRGEILELARSGSWEPIRLLLENLCSKHS